VKSTKECKHCGCEFDHLSPQKRRVGGFINECPSCVEELGTETAPAIVGVMAGDGKVAGVTVLRFDSRDRADSYMRAWRHSTGYHKGKSCQLGNTTTISMDTYGARKVGEWGGNPNHKGKL
jgi:hypothetical protein